jgi:hypothetical protein
VVDMQDQLQMLRVSSNCIFSFFLYYMIRNTTPSDPLSETDRTLRAVSSLIKQFLYDNADTGKKGKGKEDTDTAELGARQQQMLEYCMRILGR